MLKTLSSVDQLISRRLQQKPAWLLNFMRTLTVIGAPAVVSAILLILAWQSANINNLPATGAFLIAVLLIVIDATLKPFFGRSRPNTAYTRNMRLKTYSFPSGHAFGITLLTGLLVAVIIGLPIHAALIIGLITVVIAIALMVSYSRVYLGAHYFFDVLAGLAAGGLFLIPLLHL